MTLVSKWELVEQDDPKIRVRKLRVEELCVIVFAEAFQNDYDTKPYTSQFAILSNKKALPADGANFKKINIRK